MFSVTVVELCGVISTETPVPTESAPAQIAVFENTDYDFTFKYRIKPYGYSMFENNLQQNIDLGTLFVSNQISYYNSVVQKKLTTDLVPNERAIMFTKGTGDKEILPEIIIDREKNLLTERLFEDSHLNSFFAVQEPLPKMNWKLLNEKNSYLI